MFYMNIFSQPTPAEESAYSRICSEAKRLVGLEVENVKLMATEKLTLLMGRIALAAVCFVISAAALVFLSMSVADFILQDLPPRWTYLIIGCFYIVLIIVAACFRKQLIVDPIARFISRVLLDPPAQTPSDTTLTVTDNSNVDKQ